jgi:peptide/nickel transport system substrate-binding protein
MSIVTDLTIGRQVARLHLIEVATTRFPRVIFLRIKTSAGKVQARRGLYDRLHAAARLAKLKLATLGCVTVLALTGCHGQNGKVTSDGPQRGGSLTFGIAENIDTLDPAISASTSVETIDRSVVESLVRQTGPNKIEPWLAQSWSISADGKTYVVHLKPGISFQDGSPLDAASVKATLDHAVNPASRSRSAAALIEPYAESRIITDRTLEIHLKRPYTPFLQALSTSNLGIQSARELAKPIVEYQPVGTGPFRYVSWSKNSSVTLARNEFYWGSDNNSRKLIGPFLDKLIFRIISDESTRFGAFVSGQIDAMADIPALRATAIGAVPGATLRSIPQPGHAYSLFLNVSAGPLDDETVRLAFQKAVDVTALVNSIYRGRLTPAFGPLSPTTAYYEPTARASQPDPAAARRLLDDAGWRTFDSDGYRMKDGRALTLSWPFLPSMVLDQRDVIADGVIAQARAVGIKIERRPEDVGTYITNVRIGNYDIFDTGFTRANADILRALYDPNSPAATNFSRNKNAQLADWLIDAYITERGGFCRVGGWARTAD